MVARLATNKNIMNYLVSDFVVRIKNACLAKRHTVIFPYSKMNREIGKILVKEHFLEDFKEESQDKRKVLVGKIRYEKRMPVFTDASIVSKPSLRTYVGSKDIAGIERKGAATVVLSTNQGVMTGKEAIKKGVGGELLFKIW